LGGQKFGEAAEVSLSCSFSTMFSIFWTRLVEVDFSRVDFIVSSVSESYCPDLLCAL